MTSWLCRKQLNPITHAHPALPLHIHHPAQQTAALQQGLTEGLGVIHAQQFADMPTGFARAGGFQGEIAHPQPGAGGQQADVGPPFYGDLFAQVAGLQAEVVEGGTVEQKHLPTVARSAQAVAISLQASVEEAARTPDRLQRPTMSLMKLNGDDGSGLHLTTCLGLELSRSLARKIIAAKSQEVSEPK